ncbi:transposase family protein [Spirillospora sp. NBC_00431]
MVHPRRNETFAGLATAFGIGVATAHRYLTEVAEPPAALVPDSREALRVAQREAYLILDGTLVTTDRLFPADPHGEPIWASAALPSPAHDLTAAREHGIVAGLTTRAIRPLRQQPLCRRR